MKTKIIAVVMIAGMIAGFYTTDLFATSVDMKKIGEYSTVAGVLTKYKDIKNNLVYYYFGDGSMQKANSLSADATPVESLYMQYNYDSYGRTKSVEIYNAAGQMTSRKSYNSLGAVDKVETTADGGVTFVLSETYIYKTNTKDLIATATWTKAATYTGKFDGISMTITGNGAGTYAIASSSGASGYYVSEVTIYDAHGSQSSTYSPQPTGTQTTVEDAAFDTQVDSIPSIAR